MPSRSGMQKKHNHESGYDRNCLLCNPHSGVLLPKGMGTPPFSVIHAETSEERRTSVFNGIKVSYPIR